MAPEGDIAALEDFGSVSSLSVLPLIDFFAGKPGLKTEAGVSYLVRADNTTLLMDIGFNRKKEHPSPLVSNMEALGVSAQDIDMLFISHLHLDHVGGMAEQKKGVFSFSGGAVALPAIPVFSPVPIRPSDNNPGPYNVVVDQPRVLANGVASIGPMERNLFIMGVTAEHSLAVNVRDKGIVLIIGCGHQTIERIIERTHQITDAPIYGIIGGLHFPVKGGRIKVGPLNVQNILSTRNPFCSIRPADVHKAIAAIRDENPRFIALSPHDSSDWSLDQFKLAFGEICHDINVGVALNI